MKKSMVLIVLLFAAQSLLAQALPTKHKNAILDIMSRQETCWNSGKLECFMKGYWESDSLIFIGSKGPTYGWQATLDRYRKGYPDQAAMGKLTFTILEVKKMGKKHALVIGKWHLQRAEDAPEGHFSLVWRRVKGEWVIVADHSS